MPDKPPVIHQVELRWTNDEQQGFSIVSHSADFDFDRWRSRLQPIARPPKIKHAATVAYKIFDKKEAALIFRQIAPSHAPGERVDDQAKFSASAQQTREGLVARALLGPLELLGPETALAASIMDRPTFLTPRPGLVAEKAVLPDLEPAVMATATRAARVALDKLARQDLRLPSVIEAALTSPTKALTLELPDDEVGRPPASGLLWGLWCTMNMIVTDLQDWQWSFSTGEAPIGNTDPTPLPYLIVHRHRHADDRRPTFQRDQRLVRPRVPDDDAEKSVEAIAAQLLADAYRTLSRDELANRLKEIHSQGRTLAERIPAILSVFRDFRQGHEVTGEDQPDLRLDSEVPGRHRHPEKESPDKNPQGVPDEYIPDEKALAEHSAEQASGEGRQDEVFGEGRWENQQAGEQLRGDPLHEGFRDVEAPEKVAADEEDVGLTQEAPAWSFPSADRQRDSLAGPPDPARTRPQVIHRREIRPLPNEAFPHGAEPLRHDTWNTDRSRSNAAIAGQRVQNSFTDLFDQLAAGGEDTEIALEMIYEKCRHGELPDIRERAHLRNAMARRRWYVDQLTAIQECDIPKQVKFLLDLTVKPDTAKPDLRQELFSQLRSWVRNEWAPTVVVLALDDLSTEENDYELQQRLINAMGHRWRTDHTRYRLLKRPESPESGSGHAKRRSGRLLFFKNHQIPAIWVNIIAVLYAIEMIILAVVLAARI